MNALASLLSTASGPSRTLGRSFQTCILSSVNHDFFSAQAQTRVERVDTERFFVFVFVLNVFSNAGYLVCFSFYSQNSLGLDNTFLDGIPYLFNSLLHLASLALATLVADFKSCEFSPASV